MNCKSIMCTFSVILILLVIMHICIDHFERYANDNAVTINDEKGTNVRFTYSTGGSQQAVLLGYQKSYNCKEVLEDFKSNTCKIQGPYSVTGYDNKDCKGKKLWTYSANSRPKSIDCKNLQTIMIHNLETNINKNVAAAPAPAPTPSSRTISIEEARRLSRR